MTPVPCDPNEQCQNTIGSYNCGCVVGYVKDQGSTNRLVRAGARLILDRRIVPTTWCVDPFQR